MKGTQIEGNAAIGGSLVTGGSLRVRGTAQVDHNLRVNGWLEARNIKGPLKGFFAGEAALKARYPSPEEGWWALVGSSLPADVWRVDANGQWQNTNTKSGDAMLLDNDLYRELTEGLRNDLEEAKNDLMEELQESNKELQKMIGDGDSGVKKELEAFKGTKGKAGGLAPLGADGKVARSFLPLTLTMEEMNSMDFTLAMSYIMEAGLAKPVRLAVVQAGMIVGLLDMFTTSGAHELTQVFTSNFINFTGEGANHADGLVTTYIRRMGLTGTDTPQGKWTAWQLLAEETLTEDENSRYRVPSSAAVLAAVKTVKDQADGTDRELKEHQSRVKELPNVLTGFKVTAGPAGATLVTEYVNPGTSVKSSGAGGFLEAATEKAWGLMSPEHVNRLTSLESRKDELRGDMNWTKPKVEDILQWLGVTGLDDERKWYNGKEFSAIVKALYDTIGLDNFGEKADGETILNVLLALKEWTGMPSDDTGDWVGEALKDKVNELETKVSREETRMKEHQAHVTALPGFLADFNLYPGEMGVTMTKEYVNPGTGAKSSGSGGFLPAATDTTYGLMSPEQVRKIQDLEGRIARLENRE